MVDRRTEILSGELSFPNQILKLMNPAQDRGITEFINEFWGNIWHNFLREKPSNTITWLEESSDPKFFNLLLTHLSKSGWITSHVEMKYAWIELNESKLLKWITKEELINTKFKYKFLKYRLRHTVSTYKDVVQINKQSRQTGLIREGFMQAGNNVFWYDTKYLQKYIEPIAQNVKKGLRGSTKDITYQEIVDELIQWYSVEDNDYTLGNCKIDSRGRSIFNCSKKVFNPVSCKDARALLICKAKKLTVDGWNTIYAAIAELLGYRGKNIEDKIYYGQNMYILRELPSLEEMEYNSNYDDLHKRIWLERIYENIDNYEYNGWYVPIEVDALASLIQLMAVLTNDITYMEGTNLIGNSFEDIWTVPYCSRSHVKKALTPKLYGSNKEPKDLWDKNNLKYTRVQLNQISRELYQGKYANANNFKDFIINNVQPQPWMKVKINGEEFEIECNRFKWEETTQQTFFVYTSSQGIMKKITRSVSLAPDLEQFKRYFVTLLLHNLDSQVANKICKEIDWVLPNHDSFLVHPSDAFDVRKVYTSFMFEIYQNRKDILREYFQSIGIFKEYPEIEHEQTIDQFLPYCLK